MKQIRGITNLRQSELRNLKMGKFSLLSICLTLFACATELSDGRSPVIRSQAEADAYNLTITSPSEFVYCRKEEVTGTKIERTICGTVAQHEQDASLTRQSAIDTLNNIPINN